ncbi:MAG: hypothetical protein ACOCRC_04845, partial [Halodesulfurarchaeum sp.]
GEPGPVLEGGSIAVRCLGIHFWVPTEPHGDAQTDGKGGLRPIAEGRKYINSGTLDFTDEDIQ